MANICSNELRIYGDGENFNKLVSDLDAIIKNKSTDIWVAELVKQAGCNPEGMDLRAWIDNYDSDEANNGGSFSLSISSKWTPPYDLLKWIEEHYEGVGISYMAEEIGCGLYESNDLELFEDSRYIMVGEDVWEYFSTEEQYEEYMKKYNLTDDDVSVLEMCYFDFNDAA